VSTRIVILSDTHVPQRARGLPPAVWDAVDAADLVIHAGDWNGIALLDEMEQRAARLLAVRGNNDAPEFAARLPEVARETVDGIRIAVVHETGGKEGREARMAAAFADTDLLVFGHSHIPWDTVAPTGLRLLNPGSPTDRRRQPHDTFVSAVADDGRLHAEWVIVEREPGTRV
jgi:putative phosphoesterase